MSWQARYGEALDGHLQEGVEVLRPAGPPLFAGDGAGALVFAALSGIAWSVAAASADLGGPVLAPVPLGLRFVGLATALHAAVLFARLGRRLRPWTTARAHGLALGADGLLLRTPSGDHAIAATDLVAACRVADGASPRGAGWPEIVLVSRGPTGAVLTTVPPVFGPVGILLGRIRDRLGAPPPAAPPGPPPPTELASAAYDAAARGESARGVTAIPHGGAWLRRGPYAALLFAAVFVQALGALPAGLTPGPLALAALAVCLLWPALWLFAARRVVAPRRGVALVLTPTEALVRTGAGTLRAPYVELTSVAVEETRAWSVLDFRYRARTLVLTLQSGDALRLGEGFLAVPAGVVAAVVEGYRAGRFGPTEPAPNSGSVARADAET